MLEVLYVQVVHQKRMRKERRVFSDMERKQRVVLLYIVKVTHTRAGWPDRVKSGSGLGILGNAMFGWVVTRISFWYPTVWLFIVMVNLIGVMGLIICLMELIYYLMLPLFFPRNPLYATVVIPKVWLYYIFFHSSKISSQWNNSFFYKILFRFWANIHSLQSSFMSAYKSWCRVNPRGPAQAFYCTGIAQNYLLGQWFHGASIGLFVNHNIKISLI